MEDQTLTMKDNALTMEGQALIAKDPCSSTKDHDLTTKDHGLITKDHGLTTKDHGLTTKDQALTIEDNAQAMKDRVNKLREERVAREQARIQQLRDMNMKKYSKTGSTNTTNPSIAKKRTASTPQIKTGAVTKNLDLNGKNVKSSVHVNCTTKRPTTVPVTKKPDYSNIKPKVVTKFDFKSNTKSDRDTTAKSRNVPVAGNAGDVPKSVRKTKNLVNKPSTSNLEISKPDIIITEPSDDEIKNVKKLNVKTVTKNADNKPCNSVTKPDIIITTQSEATTKPNEKKVLTEITKKVTINSKLFQRNDIKIRKSFAPSSSNYELNKPKIARKSMLPKLLESSKSESVFDRLYKPKVTKKPADISEAEKLRTDPNYLRKVVKNADLIFNMHQQKKTEAKFRQRRSISAVHFKRISKSEISNCIHKWGSIDKLNKTDLNEDIPIKDNKVTSAVRSERKKVQFLIPGLSHFNTPRPDELQARLKAWLQKRGKSLSSYQHLQCFGLHQLKPDFGTPKSVSTTTFEDAIQSPPFDEENKENIALDSDSDDGSYSEMMNEPKESVSTGNKIDVTNWRNVSMASESVLNDSNASHKYEDFTLTPASSNVDDLLYGALSDLSALLREGFDWQQAARWLRSIRLRFPSAPRTAAYWECRASLEDARGNLTASLECWNEAIAKGTEESVVESNLDQLLNKFMQLKISPQSGTAKHADPKLVDVKNVFKSTIIKFAVQQAKLRNKPETPPVFTVTPVRRSARLSRRVSRTPLRLCDTVRQAAAIAPEHVFTHNDNFVPTP